jgi:hypothetical protein
MRHSRNTAMTVLKGADHAKVKQLLVYLLNLLGAKFPVVQVCPVGEGNLFSGMSSPFDSCSQGSSF